MAATPQETAPERESVEEVMSSFTGFDQIAIRQAFKESMAQLQQSDPLQLLYACAFVLKKREGMQDGQAYQTVQAMTLAEVQELFSDDSDPEGKGE